MFVTERISIYLSLTCSFLVLTARISFIKAQSQCPDGKFTFERTTGVSVPSLHILFSELHMVQNVENATWHYECYDLCKATSNCGGFYVDHIQGHCRLLPGPMNSNNIRLAFQPYTGSYFEKICIKAPLSCPQQWAFDRVVGMELRGHDDKTVENATSKWDCQHKCLWESEFECRSAEYNYVKKTCNLSKSDRRSAPKAFQSSNHNVDYFENQCISGPTKCNFNRKARTSFPYAMAKVTTTTSEANCREKCKSHLDFVCRAFVYKKQSKECLLSSDDKWSIEAKDFNSSDDSDYYERTDCMDVRMKCDATTMTAILISEYPFKGKVYAMSNPNECSTTGNDNSNQVEITLPLKSPLCGTINEASENVAPTGTVVHGNGTYTNSIIVQHHPNILTSSDRRIDVVCDYEEHKVRLKAGKQIVEPDVANITSVVTGVALTPEVQLRLVDTNGEDVVGVDLGSNIFLRVELLDEKIYGIMGSQLIARSGDDSENMTLIDDMGCPLETSVFPPFQLVPGSKSLEAPFQAFRFASDSTVRFQITISFCLNECKPVLCDTNEVGNVMSYGRRRRNADATTEVHQGDIVSDVVMEGAMFVRARLERRDISEIIKDNPESAVSLSGSSENNKKVCTSSVVVVGVGVVAAIIQIAIVCICVFITYGRSHTNMNATVFTNDQTIIKGPPSLCTSSKIGLCEAGYAT